MQFHPLEWLLLMSKFLNLVWSWNNISRKRSFNTTHCLMIHSLDYLRINRRSLRSSNPLKFIGSFSDFLLKSSNSSFKIHYIYSYYSIIWSKTKWSEFTQERSWVKMPLNTTGQSKTFWTLARSNPVYQKSCRFSSHSHTIFCRMNQNLGKFLPQAIASLYKH